MIRYRYRIEIENITISILLKW